MQILGMGGGVLHDRLDVTVLHGGLLSVAFDEPEGQGRPAVSGAAAAARMRTYCQRQGRQFNATTAPLPSVCSRGGGGREDKKQTQILRGAGVRARKKQRTTVVAAIMSAGAATRGAGSEALATRT